MEVQGVVLEFWEACVHQILYARHVYPEVIFEQRSKYGVSVWQCVHPQVNEYIQRVLLNAKPLLDAGLVERLVVSLKDSRSAPLETVNLRYEFNEQVSVALHVAELDRLERTLGSMLLKLAMWGLSLPKVPNDATFVLLLGTRDCDGLDERAAALEKAVVSDRLWLIDNDPGQQQEHHQQQQQHHHRPEIRPINSFNNVAFVKSFSLWMTADGSV